MRMSWCTTNIAPTNIVVEESCYNIVPAMSGTCSMQPILFDFTIFSSVSRKNQPFDLAKHPSRSFDLIFIFANLCPLWLSTETVDNYLIYRYNMFHTGYKVISVRRKLRFFSLTQMWQYWSNLNRMVLISFLIDNQHGLKE